MMVLSFLSRRGARLLLAVLLTLLANQPARADYSVGRLASVQGALNVLTRGDPNPHQGQPNEVLASGDQVASGLNSTAQLEFAGVHVTLGPGSVLALTRVETDGFAAYLAQGSVALGRTDDRLPASVVLDGPQVHANLDTAGRFRLEVGLAPVLEQFTVWQGRASAEVDQRSLTLYAGQVLDWAPGEMDALTLTQAASMDALDLGVINALQGWRTFAGRPYLGSDWIGAAALDQQGSWLEVSSVGPLWVPFFLPPGWAPYRAGHWSWNGVWGWTWVDDLSWSYTTFHFGRWIWWNNRWAWSPQGRQPLFSGASPCPVGFTLPPLPAPRRVAVLSRGGTALVSASIASTTGAGAAGSGAGRGGGSAVGTAVGTAASNGRSDRPPRNGSGNGSGSGSGSGNVPPLRPAWTITPLAPAPIAGRPAPGGRSTADAVRAAGGDRHAPSLPVMQNPVALPAPASVPVPVPMQVPVPVQVPQVTPALAPPVRLPSLTPGVPPHVEQGHQEPGAGRHANEEGRKDAGGNGRDRR